NPSTGVIGVEILKSEATVGDTELTLKPVTNDKELAANAIGYCNLLKSNTLDSSQGTHILLVHGKFVRYGSSKKEEELVKEFLGCYFIPFKKCIVELRKFPAIDNNTNKEWQVHIHLQNMVNALDEVGMANIEQGSTMTVIPYFVRQKLYSRQDGWKTFPIEASGYGDGVKIFQVSRDWYICLGNGINWSG
ncbi:12689_t:CDS:2, partial [Gigaspora margarita]